MKIPYAFIAAFLAQALTSAWALSGAGDGEASIFRLAETYYEEKEYYHAITETMRLQFLYPKGEFHGRSLILQGKAYWRGGNRSAALDSMNRCFEKYREKKEGEEALLLAGHIRLLADSPYYAHRTFLTYDYLYPKGALSEDVQYEKCVAMALIGELDDARAAIAAHKSSWKSSTYESRLTNLEKLIDNEKNRGKKSLPAALAGSAVLPGFGHFYAGRWEAGLATLATNAVLIFLAWDGYRDGDMLRMVLFGVAELSFYQHSLFSAARNVQIYNSRESFNRKVMMGYSTRF